MLTEREQHEFWERGFVVLRDRFRSRALELHHELQRMLDDPESGGHHGRRFGRSGLASSHRFAGVMRTNSAFSRHANDPEIVKAIANLLGPVSAFRDVVFSKPAQSGGTLAAHQDLAYWDVRHDRALTTWLALTPARLESGALWLIPGSHRQTFEHRTVLGEWPVPRAVTRGLRTLVSLTGTGDAPRSAGQRLWARLKEVSLEGITRRFPELGGLGDLQILDESLPKVERVQIEAEPGDMVLFHGRTVHGSLANLADSRRDAYLVTYVAAA